LSTDHWALQVGADYYVPDLEDSGWDVHLGVFGGWYSGDGHESTTDRVSVSAPVVGGYAVAGNGPFAIEGTIRREWRHFDLLQPTVLGPTTKKVDGGATAGTIRTSYRLGEEIGFAATPFFAFHYADSDIDNVTIDPTTFFLPGTHDTEVGQAGARLSYRVDSGDGIVLEPFASLSVLRNWSNNDQGTINVGTPAMTFLLGTTTWDDAMRYSVGIVGHDSEHQVSAFVVGNFDDGSDLHGFTVSGGVRINL
jgi:outer membrane autotransporter protein